MPRLFLCVQLATLPAIEKTANVMYVLCFAGLIPLAISKSNRKVIRMAERLLSYSVQVLMSYQTKRTDSCG